MTILMVYSSVHSQWLFHSTTVFRHCLISHKASPKLCLDWSVLFLDCCEVKVHMSRCCWTLTFRGSHLNMDQYNINSCYFSLYKLCVHTHWFFLSVVSLFAVHPTILHDLYSSTTVFNTMFRRIWIIWKFKKFWICYRTITFGPIAVFNLAHMLWYIFLLSYSNFMRPCQALSCI